MTDVAVTRGAESRSTAGVPWLSVVLPLGVLVAFADQFWVVALRTGVGAVERTSAPAASWLRESVLLLPVYVLALVAALAVVHRRPGAPWRRAVLGTTLVAAVAATLAGGAVLLASSAYDYRLQSLSLIQHAETHPGCLAECLAGRDRASLLLQGRAVGVGTVLILLTNTALLLWATALRGRRLETATDRRPVRERKREDDLAAGLAAVLAAAAIIHLAVVPEHLAEWWAAAVFFVGVGAAQLLGAVLVHRSRSVPVLALTAAGSAALIALWVVSRTTGLPFGPEVGEPEAVGVADVVAGLLELAAVGLCLVLARPAPSASARPSAHLRGMAAAATLAAVTIGIGTSGLPAVGLLADGAGHAEDAAP